MALNMAPLVICNVGAGGAHELLGRSWRQVLALTWAFTRVAGVGFEPT